MTLEKRPLFHFMIGWLLWLEWRRKWGPMSLGGISGPEGC